MFGMIVGILFGLYVTVAVINAAGVIFGALFSWIIRAGFSLEGLAIGIVLGVIVFFRMKKRNA